jgi:hypothetical protein
MSKSKILKTAPIVKHWIGKVCLPSKREFQYVIIKSSKIPPADAFVEIIEFDGSKKERDFLLAALFNRKVVA